MDKNLEKVVEWCQKEGIEPGRVPSVWSGLQLARFPSGLDYYVLDSALFYSPGIAFNWLRHSFGVGVVCTSIDQVAAFVESGMNAQLALDRMDFMRRRRVRMDPKWDAKREALVNRILRVRRRAEKLMEEESGNEKGGGCGSNAGAVRGISVG